MLFETEGNCDALRYVTCSTKVTTDDFRSSACCWFVECSKPVQLPDLFRTQRSSVVQTEITLGRIKFHMEYTRELSTPEEVFRLDLTVSETDAVSPTEGQSPGRMLVY